MKLKLNFRMRHLKKNILKIFLIFILIYTDLFVMLILLFYSVHLTIYAHFIFLWKKNLNVNIYKKK